MQTVPRVKIVMSPVVYTDDGGTWGIERTHVWVDRWRKTPFGKINFGWSWMSSPRYVRIK